MQPSRRADPRTIGIIFASAGLLAARIGLRALAARDPVRLLFPLLTRGAMRRRCRAAAAQHGDHVGGFSNQFRHRLRMPGRPSLLIDKPVYATTPVAMANGRVAVVDGPMQLAPGVGSTGAVPVKPFVFGTTWERALAVRVAGRGLVLIVGCGDPGIAALLERAEQAFGGPVYGVIGGFHLPVTCDRVGLPGVNMQRLLGTADPPWVPLAPAAVDETIDCLRPRQVQLVAPSAHDACDWSLARLAEAFGGAYRQPRVGEEVRIQS